MKKYQKNHYTLVQRVTEGLNDELQALYKEHSYTDKTLLEAIKTDDDDTVVRFFDFTLYGGSRYPLDSEAVGDGTYEVNDDTLTKHIKIWYNTYINNEFWGGDVEYKHNYTPEEAKQLTLIM